MHGEMTIRKKKTAIWVMILILATSLLITGCSNRQWIDTTYRFDYATIRIPDGTIISGTCTSWNDYEDSDAVQVVIDGVTYLTHYSNVVLQTKQKR